MVSGVTSQARMETENEGICTLVSVTSTPATSFRLGLIVVLVNADEEWGKGVRIKLAGQSNGCLAECR